MSTDQQQPHATPKSSRGCLYGCLIVGGIMIAGVLCAGIGGYMFVKGQVEKWTSATPVEIPVVEYTPEQLAELEKRIESFGEAAEGGDSDATELVLSAEEINAWLSKDENLKGNVFVRIEDGQVSADVSVPLNEVPIPGTKGRYFNGSASVDVSMEGGVLVVTMTDAEVNGERLPEDFIQGMSQQNLAQDVYKNPDNAKMLRRFDDIRIEGDKLHLKLREQEPENTEQSENAESSENGESLETNESDASNAEPVPAGA